MNKIIQDNRCEFLKKPIFGLILVVIGSIIFKLLFFPLEIPVVLDGIDYYFFAMDIKITDEIPINYSPTKIGWPIFLSIIFNIVPSNETFVFMEIQKLSTIIISSFSVGLEQFAAHPNAGRYRPYKRISELYLSGLKP